MILYEHPEMRDVAIEVLKTFYIRETAEFKFRIRWWNIGKCHAPWSMNLVENIRIPASKWAEFYELPEWKYSGHEYRLEQQ